MKEPLKRLDVRALQHLLVELKKLPINQDDCRRAVQELQIHQIELEQQNRELQEVQQTLEASRDQYAELYDWAPVGYATLDRTGTIRHINLTGARLFGTERTRLIGNTLGRFLRSGQDRLLLNHLAQVMNAGEPCSLEVSVPTEPGQELNLRLLSECSGSETGEPVCRMALVDVTEEKCALTALKRAEKKVASEREFLQSIIDGIADPVQVISADYAVLLMNDAARRTHGVAVQQTPSTKCHQVHGLDSPCRGDQYPCPLKDVLASGLPQKVLHRHPDSNGRLGFFELSVTPLRDDVGNTCGIIEVSRDVTDHLKLTDELRERESQLEHQAQHDTLTGLPNRLLFTDRLNQAIHRVHRLRKQGALLFVDLDRFKKLNDSLGHPAGDQVLKEVAHRLGQLFREDDTVARLGGDEFTVVLATIAQPGDAGLVAKKIMVALEPPFQVDHQHIYMTTSIGISVYPDDGNDADALVRNADSAMYKAKDQGRNTFRYYTEDMTALALEHVLMETSLRQAVANQEFVLHYQPQMTLETGRVVGIEALIRWNHPSLGLVYPARFIPVAEDTGMIEPIGHWVLQTACSQLQQWQEQGLHKDVNVVVNLSRRQLDDPALPDSIRTILTETRVSPHSLGLEITESLIMTDPEKAARTLQGLRKLDLEIAIDDFGTGYSSLSHLKSLPVSTLKIDKSFVMDMPGDADDVAITRALIALGQSLNLGVIAEGVETWAQAALLERAGCDVGQGYYYSRPVPTAEFAEFWKMFQ